MTGYTKLFASIVDSTIWRESKEIKIVWITMLAKANRAGIVEASVPGLADAARVTISECEEALRKLESPDIYSRTKEYEGRRIKTIDGGWLILNHAKYRAKMNADERREYLAEKKRQERENAKRNVNTQSTNVNKCQPPSTLSTHAEAEAEAEAIHPLSPPPKSFSTDPPKKAQDEKTEAPSLFVPPGAQKPVLEPARPQESDCGVERPKGFPENAEAALAMTSIAAIPEETARICYMLAVSRGYRDARGQTIRSFVAYCQANLQIGRANAAQKTGAPGMLSGIAPRKRWQIAQGIESVEKRIAEVRREMGIFEESPGRWKRGRKLTLDEETKLAKLKSDRASLKKEFDNAKE